MGNNAKKTSKGKGEKDAPGPLNSKTGPMKTDLMCSADRSHGWYSVTLPHPDVLPTLPECPKCTDAKATSKK